MDDLLPAFNRLIYNIPIIFQVAYCIILTQKGIKTSTYFPLLNIMFFVIFPLCYLVLELGPSLKTSFLESFVLNIFLGLALSLALYVSNIYFFNEFHTVLSSVLICVLSVLTFIFTRLTVKPSTVTKTPLLQLYLDFLMMGIAFTAASITLFHKLPPDFWRGWDTWIYAPVTDAIFTEGLKPSALISVFDDANVRISGFFYFLAFVKTITGANTFFLLRYGSVLIGSSLILATYIMLRGSYWRLSSLAGALLLLLNPFYIHRLSMTLRENFAFIYLIIIIFFLIRMPKDSECPHRLKVAYYSMFGLLSFVVVVVHPLTSLLLMLLIMGYNLHGLSCDQFHVGIWISTGLSILVSFPISYYFVRMFYGYTSGSLIGEHPVFFATLGALIMFILWENRAVMKKLIYYKKRRLIYALVLIDIVVITLQGLVFNQNAHEFLNLDKFSLYGLSFSLLYLIFFRDEMNHVLSSLVFSVLAVIPAVILNVPIPFFRLSIYLSLIFSFFFSSFTKKFSELDLSNYVTIKIELQNLPRVELNKHRLINVSALLLTLFLVVLSPLLLIDIRQVESIRPRSNYLLCDLEGATLLAESLEKDELVIPGYKTLNLLLYARINDTQLASREDIQALYEADDLYELQEISSILFPEVEKITYYGISRGKFKLEEYNSSLSNLFELHGEKRLYKPFTRCYSLDLHEIS
ncbi:MAG: hypothetical protein JRJ66_04635 [Deltaproteobacteria bacterium]|nr:hypothetical protein [Deltaproteobacteria bacterium]